MASFLNEVDEGMKGKYKGVSIQLEKVGKTINNLQRRTYYLVGAPAKSGKTALVDKLFVLDPYECEFKQGTDVRILYFSYEVPLIDKMAKFCAYYLSEKYSVYDDYGNPYDLDYILGKGDRPKLTPRHRELVEEIYNDELRGIFGEDGKNNGMVRFFEDRRTPYGIRNEVLKFAESRGTILKEPYNHRNEDGSITKRERITGYKPNNEREHIFVIVDHLGLMNKDKGMDDKAKIDAMSSNFVWMRNMLSYSPVAVQQIGRSISGIDKMKFAGNELQPTSDEFKGSGNPVEDCNMCIALFNPSMFTHLHDHKGFNIDQLTSKYRSFHILESRNTESGICCPMFFIGQTGQFYELPDLKTERYKVDALYKANNIYEAVKVLKPSKNLL